MNAAFGVGNPVTELVYQASFGNTPDHTCYIDGLNTAKTNEEIKSTREDIKASLQVESNLMATGTTYSATSGSIPVLVPTVIDPEILEVTRQDYPLSSGLLRRVTNRGLFADYVKQTVLPQAKFKPEGAALDSNSPTLTRTATPMKYMYSVGEVTGPLMVASKVWKDALSIAQKASFTALKKLEENTIINGNPTTGDTSGQTTDENAFTGLIQGITTNTTAKGGAEITIDNLRDGIRTIREANGHPDLIVTDFRTFDHIKGLIQAQLRYPAPTDKIAWGIKSIEFEGVPIITDILMPTTAAVRELLILDSSVIEIRVLQDATFEELAKTSDSFKFMYKQYITLLIKHEAWNYRYYTLA